MRNILVLLTMAALSAFPGRADLVGETIEISRSVPSNSITFGPYSYTVGTSAPVALSTGNNDYASASGTDLFLTFGPNGGSGGPFSAFGDFILFDDLYATTSTIITGLNFTTDLPGFVSSDLMFTDHSVTVGVGGITFSGGQTLDIALQTATVPEPSGVKAVPIGLIILVLVNWRRNTKDITRARKI